MRVSFLYCIDEPKAGDRPAKTASVKGWLLCSMPIMEMKTIGRGPEVPVMHYGISRPDLAKHFPMFPGNTAAGFTIEAPGATIDLDEKLPLKILVNGQGKIREIFLNLDLRPEKMHSAEVDDDEKKLSRSYLKTEKKFLKTLEKHPWLTIRMDIVNKCNLRCIMCHYKEEEIHSQPLRLVTPEQLRHQLDGIAPYVKHIMLSCGFEPLMSKHFAEILIMLAKEYPHMEIGLCTNGMLMNSKARKAILENGVTHVILSLDGVAKSTVERIRTGADYAKIIGNIKALRDLKKQHRCEFPKMFMDFVLMESNIHEAPAFVRMCAELGMELIDFRHLVGNIFFSDHPEMMHHNKARYNYYRECIVEAARQNNMDVRLPEPFECGEPWQPDDEQAADFSDFSAAEPDTQTEEIVSPQPRKIKSGQDADFAFLAGASCLRPFQEIMIIDQEKVLPCSYYHDVMGILDGRNNLKDIFMNENFRRVRRSKLFSSFDHNCLNCPIRDKLLPTEIAK